MLVLCLDTATPDVAAAAVDTETGEVWAQVVRDPRGAGERLMPLAVAALADAGASLRDLGAVAVGLGPGPYTGLRAGVVTAATLGLALDVPAFGGCSLDVWALPDRPCLVATDARRREVFWAAYEGGVRVDGPHVERPAAVPAAERVVGPGAVLLGAAPDDRPCPVGRLASLVDLGAEPATLAPTYLRRPDAALPPGQLA